MGDNYTQWLEGEMAWVTEVENRMKTDAQKYILLLPAGFAVVLGVIGILVGGISGMIQNVIIGLGFGLVCIPLFFLLMASSYPVKKHRKAIKAEIEDVLSPAEREDFAMQMFEIEDTDQCVSWIDDEKMENWVRVNRDYALRTAPGVVVLVQLGKVERIEKDVREYFFTTRGSGFKMEHSVTVYPMEFYYRKQTVEKKRTCDKVFTFGSREMRERASQCFRKVTELQI